MADTNTMQRQQTHPTFDRMSGHVVVSDNVNKINCCYHHHRQLLSDDREMFSEKKGDRNVVRKKIRSISEGNFQSCYASNKAEKFKLYRLSQGIESCAQAQALKIRKEEKELKKALSHLEAEKHKHATERKLKQAYFKFLTVDPHAVPRVDDTDAQAEDTNNVGDAMSLPNIHQRAMITSASTLEQDLKKVARIRAERNREVTPFYMEKTYNKFHQQDADDEKMTRGRSPSISSATPSSEIPTWKKESTKSTGSDSTRPIGSKSVTFEPIQIQSIGDLVEQRKNSLSNKKAKTLQNLALIRTKLVDDEYPTQNSSGNIVSSSNMKKGSHVFGPQLRSAESLRLKPQSSIALDKNKRIASYNTSSTFDLDDNSRRASSIVHRPVNVISSTDSTKFPSSSTLKSDSSLATLDSKSTLFSRKCSSIPSSNEPSFSSFLTPLERQELNTKIYRNTTQLDLDRRFRMLNEAQKLRRQTLVHENKAAFFKNLLKAKMIESASQVSRKPKNTVESL